MASMSMTGRGSTSSSFRSRRDARHYRDAAPAEGVSDNPMDRAWHLCKDCDVRYMTVEIPVWLWQRIDGCVDNSMAVDLVNGGMEPGIAASCVRDARWRASAGYGDERASFGWPPREHSLAIMLRLAHWEWVLVQLERWTPNDSDGAVEDYSIRAIIRAALSVA